MKICHNCGRELENSIKNCIRCNEEQYDDAVIFKTSPKPPPEVKIRKPAQTNAPQVPVKPPTQPAQPTEPMGATQPAPFPPTEPMGATQPAPFPPTEPMGATQPAPFPPTEPMGATQVDMSNEQAPPIGVDTNATIDPNVLEEIIASETTSEDDGKTKTNSMSVLVLLILIFVIVLIILRPILIDALVPSSPSPSVNLPTPQVQPQATPEATPQDVVEDVEEPEVATSNVILDEEFPHIEHLGKNIEELGFDVSLQNDNTYGFTEDGVSILFTVDDASSITNVQYKSNYVVNATDTEGIEKNIATVTEICGLFDLQNAIAPDDDTVLSLIDLTSSSFIEAGIETATYKAVFVQDDTTVTATVDYSLVAGLYSVVQLIDFSNDSHATTTTESATHEVTIPLEVDAEENIINSSVSDSPDTGVAVEGNLRGM